MISLVVRLPILSLGMLFWGCMPAAVSSATDACAGSEPVAWSEMVQADGAELYLLTRGEHCDAPVMVWLHGGPGAAERPLFRLYNRALEQDLTVAYWDQRGAGRSYSAADLERLSLAQHVADLDVIVDHLRRRLGQEQVTLVGHSWGSALGLVYARRHPEKVAAFIGVAQFVSGIAAQRAQREFVEAQAQRTADQKTLDQLRDIGSPPYSAEQALKMQRLVDRFGGVFHTRPSFIRATVSGIFRGYVTPWEIAKIIRANDASLDAMADEIARLDLREAVTAVEVPAVFMLGRHDRQLDSRLGAEYFHQLRAPAKSLIWFEQSAHNIPFEEPGPFNERMKQALEELGILRRSR